MIEHIEMVDSGLLSVSSTILITCAAGMSSQSLGCIPISHRSWAWWQERSGCVRHGQTRDGTR